MRGRIGLAIQLLVALACGGTGGGGPTSGPEAFIGTWDATGEVTLSLSTAFGPLSSVVPGEGVATIASGSRADEIVLSHENGCTIPATVVEQRATVADGTSCTVTEAGSNVTITFHDGTITRKDDGTLSLDASGDAIATTSGSPLGGGSGSFTWAGTLTRAAP